jgi:Kef-type K+ transport system membrane component KefB
MSTTEIFLLAMLIIFVVPYAIWRLFRTDYVAPLVIVQIIMGVVLGPGVLGAAFPEYHKFVFNPDVVKTLNGIAQWGVMGTPPTGPACTSWWARSWRVS